jgi:hypothetical protein
VFGGQLVGNNSDQNWDAVASIHRQWPSRLAVFGVSGYLIGTPYLLGPAAPVFLEVIMPNASSKADLQNLLAPMLAEATSDAKGSVSIAGVYQHYPLYGNWAAPVTPGDDSVGYPGTGTTKLITSWLYGEAELANPGLKDALMGGTDNSTLLWSDFTAGPGTHNPPFIRGGGNAVNPAWRSAIVRPAAEKSFPGVNAALLAQSKADFLRFGQSFRKLAPFGGTYANEADVNTPDPHFAFYGANYPRLLQIKLAVDPSGVFWCKDCVGSEMWQETANGSLCRP